MTTDVPSTIRDGSEPAGHDPLDTPLQEIDRPESDLEEAAAIEAGVSEDREYGRPGRPMNRRTPFYIGLVGTLGVALAATAVWGIYTIRHLLLLLGLAFFIAVGLDPAVRLLNRWVPRWAAVTIVVLGVLGIFAGFLALAVPVMVTESTNLAHRLPHDLKSLNDPKTTLGGLNAKYHLESRLAKFGSGSSLTKGIIGAGRAIFGVISGSVIVAVVTIYLLSDLRRVRHVIYQLAPRSRRARAVLLTDEIFDRVGGYVLGNMMISIIAGIATYVWSRIFSIPFPLLLALLVALLDLIPIVGSTIGGVIVAVAAISVSVPVAVGTLVFYVLFRLAEDYLLTPHIMGRTVKVPGLVTIVAVIVGGSLLGIIGALVAIPVAAAIILLVEEVGVPRLDKT